MNKTCRFAKLLEEFQETGKQVALITTCGTRLGRIIEINQDYVKFKGICEETMVFFNLYLKMDSITGVEEVDTNE